MVRQVFVVVFVLLCVPFVASAQGLDPFYARVAEDLSAGKPLVIVAHYGMWQVRADNPERNLNWGVYYGHATMMRRASRDTHIAKNYVFHDWKLIFEREGTLDPLRTLVFSQTVKPNKYWRAAGVTQPFTVFLVMYAHKNQEGAALAATKLMRQSLGESLTLDDGATLDTSAAQATGYFGHNFFYDYEDFRWDGLSKVSGEPSRTVGIFSVGCNTARVPGFDAWYGPNTAVLLYSKSLMASEGYSTLALMDGVLRHLSNRELVELGDRTYKYFQKLGKPDRRVGSPFVAQDHKLNP
jgi:hypothetical protein